MNVERLAGAPISWGVCEVPGWGYQLSPQRVLAEMRAVGLAATELGPDGFLPADPDRTASVLDEHHVTAVGHDQRLRPPAAGHVHESSRLPCVVPQALHGLRENGLGILGRPGAQDCHDPGA